MGRANGCAHVAVQVLREERASELGVRRPSHERLDLRAVDLVSKGIAPPRYAAVVHEQQRAELKRVRVGCAARPVCRKRARRILLVKVLTMEFV